MKTQPHSNADGARNGRQYRWSNRIAVSRAGSKTIPMLAAPSRKRSHSPRPARTGHRYKVGAASAPGTAADQLGKNHVAAPIFRLPGTAR